LLHQRQDGMLVGIAAARFAASFLAGEGFIDLYNLASATHRRPVARIHSFEDAVRHEPSGPVLHSEDAHKLAAADAFLLLHNM